MPEHVGRVERGDPTSLILSFDGRQFRMRIEDVSNVIAGYQVAAQLWELNTVAKGQSRLEVTA